MLLSIWKANWCWWLFNQNKFFKNWFYFLRNSHNTSRIFLHIPFPFPLGASSIGRRLRGNTHVSLHWVRVSRKLYFPTGEWFRSVPLRVIPGCAVPCAALTSRRRVTTLTIDTLDSKLFPRGKCELIVIQGCTRKNKRRARKTLKPLNF